MRRIAYMHGYVFPAACTNFRPLGFSLLAGWKCGMVFLFVSVENSMTSFERSRKEEKNYMKPVQTGLNRFCTQTRLEKRAIIVIIVSDIKPKTTELGLLTLTLTGNCISTTRRCLTFDLSLGLLTLQGSY